MLPMSTTLSEIIEILKKNDPNQPSLTIESDDIDDAGVTAIIAELTINTSLTSLDFGNNTISSDGMMALAEMLKTNTTLILLYCQWKSFFRENEIYQTITKRLSRNKVFKELKNNSLTSLNLSRENIDDADAKLFASALKVNTSLTTLGLGWNNIGDAGATALADALRFNTSLTELHIWNNNIGDVGGTAFAEMLRTNTTMTSLALWDNRINDEIKKTIRKCLKRNEALKELENNSNTSLYLWNENIDDEDAKFFAGALKVNTSLTGLTLYNNQIGGIGATAFADALRFNTSLTSLDLHNNQIGDAGATALADALRFNTSLTSLDLYNNQIGDAGATALAEALRFNTSLTSLDLYKNDISDEIRQAIRNRLLRTRIKKQVNNAVTSLDFHRCKIDDAGAMLFANELKVNTFLTTLNLKRNDIGDAGVTALADALKINTSLRLLNFKGNDIGDAGATALADALKINTSLRLLNLKWNDIGDAGATALADALKINTSLRLLNLKWNDIGTEGETAFVDALKVNTALTSLKLNFYRYFSEIKRYIISGLNRNNVLSQLKNNTLTSLNLSKCGVNFYDDKFRMLRLAALLEINTSLTSLNLKSKKIDKEVATALSDGLKNNTSLTSLNLGWNRHFGDEGAIALADALKINTSLTSLNLGYCKIGDSGGIALVNALLVNNSLTSLRLDGSYSMKSKTKQTIKRHLEQNKSDEVQKRTTLMYIMLSHPADIPTELIAQTMALTLKADIPIEKIIKLQESLSDAKMLHKTRISLSSALSAYQLGYGKKHKRRAASLEKAVKSTQTIAELRLLIKNQVIILNGGTAYPWYEQLVEKYKSNLWNPTRDELHDIMDHFNTTPHLSYVPQPHIVEPLSLLPPTSDGNGVSNTHKNSSDSISQQRFLSTPQTSPHSANAQSSITENANNTTQHATKDMSHFFKNPRKRSASAPAVLESFVETTRNTQTMRT